MKKTPAGEESSAGVPPASLIIPAAAVRRAFRTIEKVDCPSVPPVSPVIGAATSIPTTIVPS